MTLATLVAALCAWGLLSVVAALTVAGLVRLRDRQVGGPDPAVHVELPTQRRAEPADHEPGGALLG